MARKQPTGGKEFDALMKKLAQVPRKELDREAAKDARKKQQKRGNK